MKQLWQKYEEKCKYAKEYGVENTYYTAFENLLDREFTENEDYIVINNPKDQKKIGHPDFQVLHHKIPMINIEAKPVDKDILVWLKDPTTNNDSKRFSNQIHKYHSHKEMVILATDFKTIWWIDTDLLKKDEEKEIPILHEFHLLDADLNILPSHEKEWERLINLLKLDVDRAKAKLNELLDNIMPFIKNLKKEMKRIMNGSSKREEQNLRKHLLEIRSDLTSTLFSETSDFKKQFIDLYTQLIAYGMFLGWLRYNKGKKRTFFDINTVATFLPQNSLLQNLFTEISNNLSDQLSDEIFNPIQKWFNKTEYVDITFRLDELMNEFYSGFLEKYDKELKKDMGVVYTPEEVVNFTIRGIDHFLQTRFNLKSGILHDVKYLDTSAGTMSYPCELMKLAYKRFREDEDIDPLASKGGTQERFSLWFRKNFLRRDDGSFGNVFGFEVLMSPYILGSIRTLMMAEKFGTIINYKTDRVQMYLLNTLMDVPPDKSIEEWLSPLYNRKVKSELQQGLEVRSRKDIMVVMSNPPYNISSQNSSKWITKMVDEYVSKESLTREEGKPQIKAITGLKSSKDDYWKFIRFAQWKITENNQKGGIVGYVTNNFYLDGLIARGMRKELRKAFNEIYIVNLHGDWKKIIPERVKNKANENIFGVNCGVAIVFMIRYDKKKHYQHKKNNPYQCEVKYSELWGTKEERLLQLKNSDVSTMEFKDCGENLDWEFTPYIESNADYDTFPYLCDIFRKNIQGVVTAHDTLVSHISFDGLCDILYNYYTKSFDSMFLDHFYKDKKGQKIKGIKYSQKGISFNDNRDWNIKESRQKSNFDTSKKRIIQWQWRGFDKRWICYDKPLINDGTDRFSLMQYLLPHQNNVGLICGRRNRQKKWSNCLISAHIFDNGALEGAVGGGNAYSFPLKINISNEPDDFDNPKLAIHSNLNPQFMKLLPYWDWNELSIEDKMQNSEVVFYYIYGVLYTPTYRDDYKGLLAIDFPRIPFPSSKELFEEMSGLGKELASYHLMTNEKTKDVGRQKTNIKELEMPKGLYSVKVGKRKRWISYKDNPFTPEGDQNMGLICFHSTIRSQDGKKYDCPDENYLIIYDIPKKVWNFEIGGRKQLDDWLMSRRYHKEPQKNCITRGLTKEELTYFIQIINAIEDTFDIRTKLERIFTECSTQFIPFESTIKKARKNKNIDKFI